MALDLDPDIAAAKDLDELRDQPADAVPLGVQRRRSASAIRPVVWPIRSSSWR
jgi:hypothetical protein